MTKHVLLPDTYKDSATHAAILSALKPYEMPGASAINNPNTRWNLHKAWEEAGDLLEHSRWHYNDKKSFDVESAEYLFPAYTNMEIEHANIIMAGIVAGQILNPEKEIFMRRIEFKKGGEVDLAISSSVAGMLRDAFPGMQLLGGPHEIAGNESVPFLKRLIGYLKSSRK